MALIEIKNLTIFKLNFILKFLIVRLYFDIEMTFSEQSNAKNWIFKVLQEKSTFKLAKFN